MFCSLRSLNTLSLRLWVTPLLHWASTSYGPPILVPYFPLYFWWVVPRSVRLVKISADFVVQYWITKYKVPMISSLVSLGAAKHVAVSTGSTCAEIFHSNPRIIFVAPRAKLEKNRHVLLRRVCQIYTPMWSLKCNEKSGYSDDIGLDR